MSKVICKLRTFNRVIIMLGHSAQISCDAIGEILGYNYFKFMNEEMIEKAKSGKCRYNLKTYLMLKHLEEFENINGFKFKNIDPLLKTNNSWSNKCKDHVNTKFSNNLKIGH